MGSSIRRIFEIKSIVFVFYILQLTPDKIKKNKQNIFTVLPFYRYQLKPGCNSTRRHFKHGGRMTEAREAVKAIKLEMFSF